MLNVCCLSSRVFVPSVPADAATDGAVAPRRHCGVDTLSQPRAAVERRYDFVRSGSSTSSGDGDRIQLKQVVLNLLMNATEQ